MKCPNCRKKINDEGVSFCPHCKTYIRQINKKNKKDLFVYLVIFLFWLLSMYAITNVAKVDFYFKEPTIEKNDDKEEQPKQEENNNEEPQETQQQEQENKQSKPNNNKKNSNTTTTKEEQAKPILSKGVTSIKYDNKYLKQYSINSLNDVYFYIKKDSEDQKVNCPNEILAVEQDIINNYGVTAVNLCEMDITFARELANVVRYVFISYPNARNHLTNITLANLDNTNNYMAAYMPIFTFVTNNSITGYPMGIKSQIILNAKYFLDKEKIQSSVKYGTKSGYFPKNATRSSTVAHEFGHYLSFVAMLQYYQVNQLTYITTLNSSKLYTIYEDFNSGEFSYRLINDAYSEYVKDYGYQLDFESFRASISNYAIAKDSYGTSIYDETIAEAFHDCYLNNDNATLASQYIMKKLREYL